jgi:hypothetical protein
LTKRKAKRKSIGVSPRQITVAFYAAALLVCLGVYSGVSGTYLYNDDFVWMSAARYDMNAGNVLSYRVIGFFRPVVNLGFFVTERVFPGNLPAYYYTNLLLHLLNCVLLFHLIRRVFASAVLAAVTSMLFLVTSAHASAVIWISARTTLLSSFFLLASLVVLAHPRPGAGRAMLSMALYGFALFSKETATAGLAAVAMLHVLQRGGANTIDKKTLGAFAVLTGGYLLLRHLIMGGFTQENWGPGWHIFRNVAGGVLFQFYPWSLAALTGVGETIPESSRALWPELLALPLLAGLVVAGWRLHRLREMVFAVGWTLVCLVPASFFTFRFFSTSMATHDRYYYLSSAGMCLAVSLLLWTLWRVQRAKALARVAVTVVVVVVVVGETLNVGARKERWRTVTGNYRTLVSLVEERLDESRGLSTCAIENSPMQHAYLRHALRLERPHWTVEKVASEEEAVTHRPCLYVRFEVQAGRIRTAAAAVR